MPSPLVPKFRWIWYGDGEWALEIDKKDTKDKAGVECWEFLIQPSEQIIERFNLRDPGKLDRFGHCTRLYPKSQVEVLNDSPVRGRIFVHTDFEGRDTQFSRRRADYTETINTQQKLVQVLRAQLAYVIGQLRISTSQEHEHWKQVIDVVRTIRQASAIKMPADAASIVEGTQDIEQQ